MYARNVTLQLKANTAAEFTRTLENDVLPILRKYGFDKKRFESTRPQAPRP